MPVYQVGRHHDEAGCWDRRSGDSIVGQRVAFDRPGWRVQPHGLRDDRALDVLGKATPARSSVSAHRLPSPRRAGPSEQPCAAPPRSWPGRTRRRDGGKQRLDQPPVLPPAVAVAGQQAVADQRAQRQEGRERLDAVTFPGIPSRNVHRERQQIAGRSRVTGAAGAVARTLNPAGTPAGSEPPSPGAGGGAYGQERRSPRVRSPPPIVITFNGG